MARQGAVTFKGAPLTLVGEALQVGQPAPAFTLHYFQDGMQPLTLEDLKGKPALLSVVPSLDTGVCATQTKTFNEKLGALGEKVHAVTVSLDLPFAQGRFCGDQNISNMRTASDYMTRKFGEDYGLLIDELKLLARAIVVLDSAGQVIYTETVPEMTSEPNYDEAMQALQSAS